MVSAEQMQTALRYIEHAEQAKAPRSRLGGKRARVDSGGFYVEPTVFDQRRRPTRRSRARRCSGRCSPSPRFKDRDEAIRLANDTVYGLAAGLWTRDVRLAHRAAREIKAGLVWVNGWDACDITMPFGGFKQSGFGRDRSLHALHKYADLKSVSITITLKEIAMNMISKKFPDRRPHRRQMGHLGQDTFPSPIPRRAPRWRACPNLGAKETRDAIDAASRALPGLVGQDRQGARGHPASAGSISSPPTPRASPSS